MKIITAPEIYKNNNNNNITCFLAGGITNCPNWQNEVIKNIQEYSSRTNIDLRYLDIYNPRRENFPIDNPNAAQKQIEWEFKYPEECDIFSMYFCNAPSDQPICMYELGRNISEIKKNYSKTWEHRIIISVEKGYKREQDVFIQTRLATNSIIKPFSWATPVFHAMAIVNNYDWLLKNI